MKTVLGIDIGGTKIAGGVVDAATGALLHHNEVPTKAEQGGAPVLARAIDLAHSLFEEAGDDAKPSAVGVGAGGQIDPKRGIVLSATEILPGWAGTDIKGAFVSEFGLPCAVDNDVNALAVGECRFGAGRGKKNLLFLALGTGVGGAIVSNGKIHHGARGAGGELGHLVLFPEGRPYPSGRGVLEAYVSGPALWQLYQEMGGAAESPLHLLQEAGEQPSGIAAQAVQQIGVYLGLGLVSLANIFDPESILIGGGLAAWGHLLLQPAREVLQARALPPVRTVPVETAALGRNASVIGAASLVI